MAATMTTTVRYRFLSSRDFSEIQMQGPYVTVADLKQEIFRAKFRDGYANSRSQETRRRNSLWNGCCLGTDHDLSILDPVTKTPYSDENALIFDKASVLLRRIPGDRRRHFLNTAPIDLCPEVEEEVKPAVTETPSGIEDLDYNDFGGDVYSVPSEVIPPANPPTAAVVDGDEESKKIMALVNAPALGTWSSAAVDSATRKRKFPAYSAQQLPPPIGYVCHRCGIKGHFIQDCPTNGDPRYDHRNRMRPTSMAPSVAAESEFNKQMDGISSSLSSVTTSTTTTSSSNGNNGASVGVLPAELNCPICRGVMREAVFVKSCCFRSYCKSCIKDYVQRSKSCACGAGNVEESDFLPNVTVRSMIDAILLRRSCSSGSSAGSNSCCSTVISTEMKLYA